MTWSVRLNSVRFLRLGTGSELFPSPLRPTGGFDRASLKPTEESELATDLQIRQSIDLMAQSHRSPLSILRGLYPCLSLEWHRVTGYSNVHIPKISKGIVVGPWQMKVGMRTMVAS